MGEPCKLLKHLVELAYAKGLRSDRKLCRLSSRLAAYATMSTPCAAVWRLSSA
jgi:hypothetical protein